ncbi:GTP 3',8-cyclase MoaA [Sediminivirga luteola]|uniref:GTP 3',8-cyclase n=1 Tax=Sediminivirga luteola TaxID=1774748 RepID=A0A8J2TVG1_9MICO|nr:GTP 3',8-cyclase MoaA [Sediminivirga luteola]GGA03495.1 cyclic pyranopterin monophosphate synthase [Sediminivirga luteola]
MSVDLGLPTFRLRADSPSAPGRPDHPGLIDRFGRIATDLRVSLTDRCNLRCTYCMPAEGLDWTPKAELLTDEELLRLLRIGVERLGIREVRFTGGEPLLRRGLETVIAGTAALRTRGPAGEAGAPVEISLTTNAIGLDRRASALAAAGLRRINVSLDTLDEETFRGMTHRDRLPDVLAGLQAARAAGLDPVKINAVLMPGQNDHQAADLLEWAIREGYQLRFIEQMPLDAQHAWTRDGMITAADILRRLERRFHLTPADPSQRGSAPAELWHAQSRADSCLRGTVGVIASVTRNFCAACDRTRLTADGQLRNCLFGTQESDLRALLRDPGRSDEDIAAAWRANAWAKKAGHGQDTRPAGADDGFIRPSRPMSAIGG